MPCRPSPASSSVRLTRRSPPGAGHQNGAGVGQGGAAAGIGSSGGGYDGAPRLPQHPRRRRQPGAAVQHHPRRLPIRWQGTAVVGPRRQLRIVRQRGADAYHNPVHFLTHPVHARPRRRPGDPLRMPGAGGDFAVQTHSELGDHKGHPGQNMLAERLVQPFGCRMGAMLNYDARRPQRRHAAAGHARVGVGGGVNHPRHAGGDDGIGAGRRPSVVAAGFQGNIKRSPLRRRAGLLQGADFGVPLPRRQGIALADDGAVPRQNRAHRRVGAGGTERAARQGNRPCHRLLFRQAAAAAVIHTGRTAPVPNPPD